MPEKSYFRPEIDAMAGYVPGEQPKIANLVKLNTNENPYPPSPLVKEALADLDYDMLRRYPDPTALKLRTMIAGLYALETENIIIGNGSDDILTMIFRAFTDRDRSMAMFDPSYSLYQELAAMQGAAVVKVKLTDRDFALPQDIMQQISGCNLLMLTRPNAPTGTLVPLDEVRNICRNFDGIVVIDEAYGDFAPDNCMMLVKEFSNVIVMRTFSKSYSLAGIRLGYAAAGKEVISGLMKLKDSYNIDRLAQLVGEAAFQDQKSLAENCRKVCEDRAKLKSALENIGFEIPESAANFLFAMPPDRDGERAFRYLRENAVIVRYFPGAVTGRYIRITIGTPAENSRLLTLLENLYRK